MRYAILNRTFQIKLFENALGKTKIELKIDRIETANLNRNYIRYFDKLTTNSNQDWWTIVQCEGKHE